MKENGNINLSKRLSGFGLVEVIIAILLLGIIASLTIPSLVKNIKKTLYVLQLKKFYNITTFAFQTAMVNDGVSDIGETYLIRSINGTNTNRVKQDAFTKELKKYFKIAKVYQYNEYKNAIQPKYLNGRGKSTANSKAYTIFLQDGALIRLVLTKYPESRCREKTIKSLGGKFYKNYGTVYIDTNGEKGPNIMGRDYHYFFLGQNGQIYPNNGMEETIYYTCSKPPNYNYWTDSEICKDTKSYGYGCAARIMKEGWKMNY